MSMISNRKLLSRLTESTTSSSGPVLKPRKKLTAKDLPLTDNTVELVGLMTAYEDLEAGRSTYREFMEICITWAYHYCFVKDGYVPEEIPQKSLSLMKYLSLSIADLKTMNSATADRMEREKVEYFNKISGIKSSNEGKVIWLKKMADYYNWKEDKDKEEQINNRIKEYERVA